MEEGIGSDAVFAHWFQRPGDETPECEGGGLFTLQFDVNPRRRPLSSTLETIEVSDFAEVEVEGPIWMRNTTCAMMDPRWPREHFEFENPAGWLVLRSAPASRSNKVRLKALRSPHCSDRRRILQYTKSLPARISNRSFVLMRQSSLYK